MRNVLVFYGGKSAEHDVSIITGVLTLNSIDKSLFKAYPIYVDKSGKWWTGEGLNDIENYKNLEKLTLNKACLIQGDNALYILSKNKLKKVDNMSCAINCMHGLNGEDGMLVGILKASDIALASPDNYLSSLAIDKDFSKAVLSGMGVLTLPYVRVFKNTYFARREVAEGLVEKKFNYPVIVKPARLGSSIGISVANTRKELENCLILAFNYDDKVIVEPYVENFIEVNCAAYRYEDKIIVSKIEQPYTKNQILSFEDKYSGNKGGVEKNAITTLPTSVLEKVRAITEKIYRKTDGVGVIRVDYLIKDGKIYVNELNTVPGSMAYYLFCNSISQFTVMLNRLIGEGMRKHAQASTLKYEFISPILSEIKGKGCKRK